MVSLATISGSSVLLFAVILVWADPTPSFPSIDDQINEEMQAFYLLCEGGIIREVLMDRMTRILKEDYEKGRPEFNASYETSDDNNTMVFNESHHPIYLKKDNTLPQRVLDEVLKEALFLGTDKSKLLIKTNIKRDINNGTLTDVEVDNVLHKMVELIKEKTKDEMKKYIDELVSGDIDKKMAKGKKKGKEQQKKKGKQQQKKKGENH